MVDRWFTAGYPTGYPESASHPGYHAFGMRLRWLVVVGSALGLSCFSSAQYDRAHAARVNDVNARYTSLREETRQRWYALISEVEEWRKYLVPVVPNSRYAPVDRLDDDEGFVKLRKLCEDAGPGLDASDELVVALRQVQRDCFLKYLTEYYIPSLGQRYYEADPNWVHSQWSAANGEADIESLYAFSHNTKVLADISDHEAVIRVHLDESLAAIEQMRQDEIRLSAQRRDNEVVVARRQYQARMQAIGAALQSMSRSTTNRTTTSPSVYRGTTQSGCSSDFTCGIGYTCVKANFSATGYCAKAVNEYGVQTFEAPRTESVLPKLPVGTDCQGLMDCPAGFTCDLKSGACLR